MTARVIDASGAAFRRRQRSITGRTKGLTEMTWTHTRHGFYWFAAPYTIATYAIGEARSYSLAFNDTAARRLVHLGDYPTLADAQSAAVSHALRVTS